MKIQDGSITVIVYYVFMYRHCGVAEYQLQEHENGISRE